ncbi:MAG: hypothetical protein KBC15_04020 [Candidatus Levybacteria bacterium]|nr:hypothetical protein [Candidatus Levybacteria bacterium]
MIRRVAVIVSFVFAAIMVFTMPTSAQDTAQRPYAYADLASYCEADGCTQEDFYPVIDPASGQVINGWFLFLPMGGKCIDLVAAPDDIEDITILSLEGELVRTQTVSASNPATGVCEALVTFKISEPGSLIASCQVNPDCAAVNMLKSAIRLPMAFIDEVPELLIFTGWTEDGTLLIMQPGSVAASPIEHYVLYIII